MKTPIAVPPPKRARRSSGGTMVEWAYDQILSMLMTLQIAPDGRIGIDALARKFDISQTPIREALSQLEIEGLVRKTPNAGYRASPQMTRAELDELYELRMLIEPGAAALAAQRITEDQLQMLSRMQEDVGRFQTDGGAAYARFAEADAMLHQLVAQGSDNSLIADVIERLHVHLHIFRFLYATDAPREAAKEHSRIIAALLAHDAEASRLAMRDHLERSLERMVLASQSKDDEAATGQ
jgi:DNA-binding GntR family transcriptional regulator